MIDFMILANPRSGTTWIANWLTTDRSICYHDPEVMPEEVRGVPNRIVGVASTIWPALGPKINTHPARKLIVHRDETDRKASCEKLGIPFVKFNLDRLAGKHVLFEELFSNPAPIYEWLLGLPFDPERHAILRNMNVQPNFGTVTFDQAAVIRLKKELML